MLSIMIDIQHFDSLSFVSHNWFKWEGYQLPLEMVCVLQYVIYNEHGKSGKDQTDQLLVLDGIKTTLKIQSIHHCGFIYIRGYYISLFTISDWVIVF